ncbi:MAG: acyl--CoA ligase [SAR324 cluster bacterium]|nr:acyl--CoA ligase [SAR324 cluster bacterium]
MIRPNPAFNLTEFVLGNNARRFPEKSGLIFVHHAEQEEVWSFFRFFQTTQRVAGAFRSLGLSKGERVVIRLPNSPDFALAFFGAIYAGLIPVPCSTQLQAEEVDYLITNAQAALLIVSAQLPHPAKIAGTCTKILHEQFREFLNFQDPVLAPSTQAEDPAYIIYTSGTSGYPKGVLHAHRSILGRQPIRTDWMGVSEQDVLLHTGQLNWSYTLGIGLMDPWATGATTVLYGGAKNIEIWPALMEKHQVTLFASVPGIYRQLLRHHHLRPEHLAHLRHVMVAGEALSVALLEQWTQTTGVPMYEALGMSEISTYISNGPHVEVKPGSPGKPQAGRTVVILPADKGESPLPAGEEGLIAVHRSDPGLMLGYWNMPEEESSVFRGEWFVGGDLGVMDEEGYIWYHGRNNELMNPMGYRVSPLEIERVLLQHPDVADAGVTEIHLDTGISIIVAFLVLRHPDHATADQIIQWSQTHLAHYKCPREIRFIEQLPRTSNNKLARRQLISFF